MTERELLSLYSENVLDLAAEAHRLKTRQFGDRVFLMDRFWCSGSHEPATLVRTLEVQDGDAGERARSAVLDAAGEEEAVLLKRAAELRSKGFAGDISGPTAGDVWRWSGGSLQRVAEVLGRLKEAGLDLLRGEDAEILDEDWRRGRSVLPLEEWWEIHRMAHQQGMASQVVLRYGAGESRETRVRAWPRLQEWAVAGHVVSIRLEPWDPVRWPLGEKLDLPPTSGLEDLLTLSAARLAFPGAHLEVSWRAVEEKLAQTALRFGADSLSGAPWRRWEERSPVSGPEMGESSEAERMVRETGLLPVWAGDGDLKDPERGAA